MHSIELKFGMYVTDHRRKNSIDFGDCRMHSFFHWSTKKNTLRPIEYPLKGSSIQTLYSVELGTYIKANLVRILKVTGLYIV